MRRSILALALLAASGCGTTALDARTDTEFVLGGGSDTSSGGSDTDAAPADDADATDDTTAPDDIIAPPDMGVDTGAGSDTTTADVDLVCEPGSTWCEDTVLATCGDDGLGIGRVRCTERDLVCVETDSGAECGPADVLPEECTLPAALAIEPGEYVLDLCDNGDDASHIEQGDCGVGQARSGADAILTFTLEEPTSVFVDLRDDDDNAAIDTILYIRDVCEDPNSQIACSDDIPCDESDVTVGCDRGIQVRQSRLSVDLEPGTYTIVADYLEYRTFGCGQVRLLLEY